MPIYQYQCSGCDAGFECYESFKENQENPPTHCPKCDPDEDKPGTLFLYMGNCRPAFKVNGEGAFDNSWQT